MHPLLVALVVAQVAATTVFVHEGITQWALYRATKARELKTYAVFSMWSALFTAGFLVFNLPLPGNGYLLALHGLTIFGLLAMRAYVLAIDAFLQANSSWLRRLAAMVPWMGVWPVISAVTVLLGGEPSFVFERKEPPEGIVVAFAHALEPRNQLHPVQALLSLVLLVLILTELVRISWRAKPRDWFIVVGVCVTCVSIAWEMVSMMVDYRYAFPAIFAANLIEAVRITYVSTLRAGRDKAVLEHELSRQRQVIDDQLEALTASAQLAQLGSLTRELGHELRNPLASALLFVQAAERRANDGEADARLLSQARTAIGHATTLVAALHHAGRAPSQPQDAVCELAVAVQDALAIAGPRVEASGIRLEVSVPPSLRVRGQRSELIQVVLNLVTNACDACPASGDRWLRIHAHAQDGMLRMTVSDAGPRPSEHVARRLFQLSFTTKDANHGSGLGLAITHEILRRVGGSIELDAQQPHTSFVITLKAA